MYERATWDSLVSQQWSSAFIPLWHAALLTIDMYIHEFVVRQVVAYVDDYKLLGSMQVALSHSYRSISRCGSLLHAHPAHIRRGKCQTVDLDAAEV